MNLTSASIPTAQLLPFIVTYAIVSTMTTTDPSSFANVDDVQTSRFHLAVSADFSRKVLTGSMEISFSVGKDVDHVILDSRNLVVKGARLASGSALNVCALSQFGSLLLSLVFSWRSFRSFRPSDQDQSWLDLRDWVVVYDRC